MLSESSVSLLILVCLRYEFLSGDVSVIVVLQLLLYRTRGCLIGHMYVSSYDILWICYPFPFFFASYDHFFPLNSVLSILMLKFLP